MNVAETLLLLLLWCFAVFLAQSQSHQQHYEVEGKGTNHCSWATCHCRGFGDMEYALPRVAVFRCNKVGFSAASPKLEPQTRRSFWPPDYNDQFASQPSHAPRAPSRDNEGRTSRNPKTLNFDFYTSLNPKLRYERQMLETPQKAPGRSGKALAQGFP